MLGELDEFRVGTADISELRCAEPGEVGLRSSAGVTGLEDGIAHVRQI